MADWQKVVVITGAGASTNLAVEGRLPLMGEWADVLRKEIDESHGGTADSIGLVDRLEATDFEEVLGSFLAFRAGIPHIERFGALGGPNPGTWFSEVQSWIRHIKGRSNQIVEAIHRSLYREFGRISIDTEKSHSAYGALLVRLGVPQGRVVFATTNYDTSIEVGIQALGKSPNDGFPPSSWERPFLTPVGMVDWDKSHKGHIPILHLHGAVGWYFEPKGQIARQYPDQAYNPSLGIPAILPPDPNKDPTASPFVGAIWSEFIRALEGSTHILVIGHSLNDRALVEAIFKAGRHAQKGFATYSPGLKEPTQSLEDLVGGWLDDEDQRAFLIPADFGPESSFSHEAFEEWLNARSF